MDYADRYGMDEEQAERMVAYIRAMDKVYLDHFQQRIKDKWQSSTNKSAPSSTASKG